MDASVILLTLGKANPSRPNGINAAVHGLATALHEQGIPMQVWGMTPSPEVETFEREYPLRLFKRKAHRLGLDRGLKRALCELPGGSLVHFHGGLLPEFYLVARVLRAAGIPWVLTPHGCYAPAALRKGAFKKRLFLGLFDRHVLAGASRIQQLAPGSAAGIQGRVPASKLVCLPNGFSPRVGPPAALSNAHLRIVFCGRIDIHTKGLDLLLQALARSSAGVQLDLIGAGPELTQLKALAAELKLGDRVIWHGAKYGQEKTELLLQARAFALTSRHEGFPMSLAEAASLGLPLLVTEGTNFGDFVRAFGCGRVAKDAEPGAISEAINSLSAASLDELHAMGSAAQRLIQDELSWTHIAQRMQREVYAPVHLG